MHNNNSAQNERMNVESNINTIVVIIKIIIIITKTSSLFTTIVIHIVMFYLLFREVILGIYIEETGFTDSSVTYNDTFNMLDGGLAHFYGGCLYFSFVVGCYLEVQMLRY